MPQQFHPRTHSLRTSVLLQSPQANPTTVHMSCLRRHERKSQCPAFFKRPTLLNDTACRSDILHVQATWQRTHAWRKAAPMGAQRLQVAGEVPAARLAVVSFLARVFALEYPADMAAAACMPPADPHLPFSTRIGDAWGAWPAAGEERARESMGLRLGAGSALSSACARMGALSPSRSPLCCTTAHTHHHPSPYAHFAPPKLRVCP